MSIKTATSLSFCLVLCFTVSGTCGQDLQCSKAGQCVNSVLIYEGSEKTKQDCHSKCKNDFDGNDCAWFTYRYEENFCLLFSNCPNITDTGCVSCVTGQKECDLYTCAIQGSCLVTKIANSQSQFGFNLGLSRDNWTDLNRQIQRLNAWVCVRMTQTATGIHSIMAVIYALFSSPVPISIRIA